MMVVETAATEATSSAPEAKDGGPEVIRMGGNVKDSSADAGDGDLVTNFGGH